MITTCDHQMEKPKRGKRQSTNWVFTLNNYTEEEVWMIGLICNMPEDEPHFKLSTSRVKAIACSPEVGKKGTPHLQGFLQLSKKGINIVPISLVVELGLVVPWPDTGSNPV